MFSFIFLYVCLFGSPDLGHRVEGFGRRFGAVSYMAINQPFSGKLKKNHADFATNTGHRGTR
jgi:hypothetical protein